MFSNGNSFACSDGHSFGIIDPAKATLLYPTWFRQIGHGDPRLSGV